MFTPIDPDIVKIIKAQGTIKLFVFDGWEFIAAHEMFTSTPHKIVYAKLPKHNGGHYRIFDCKLTLEKHSFILENIIHPLKDRSIPKIIPTSEVLTKASEYMFIEMTLKEIERMAKLSKKERIIITSGLTTFSEVASELGFALRKPNFSNYFKATKITNYKSNKIANT